MPDVAFDRFPLRIERLATCSPEVWHGGRRYVRTGSVARRLPEPSAQRGDRRPHRSHNPWTTNFRVVLRGDRAWLVFRQHPTGSGPSSRLSPRTTAHSALVSPVTRKGFASTRSPADERFAPGSRLALLPNRVTGASAPTSPNSEHLGLAQVGTCTNLAKESERPLELAFGVNALTAREQPLGCFQARDRLVRRDPMAAYTSAALTRSPSMNAEAASYQRECGAAPSRSRRNSGIAPLPRRRVGPEGPRPPRTVARPPVRREARRRSPRPGRGRSPSTLGRGTPAPERDPKVARSSSELERGLRVLRASSPSPRRDGCALCSGVLSRSSMRELASIAPRYSSSCVSASSQSPL